MPHLTSYVITYLSMQVLTLNHVSNRGPIGIVAPVFDEVLMRVNMGKMIHNKGGGGHSALKIFDRNKYWPT